MLLIEFATVWKRCLWVDISDFLGLDHWWLIVLSRVVYVRRLPVGANEVVARLLQTVLTVLRMPDATYLVTILNALVLVCIWFGRSRSSILIRYSSGSRGTLVRPEMRNALLRAIHYARISILIINQSSSIHIEVVEALYTASASNFVKVVHVSIAARRHVFNWRQFEIVIEGIVDIHRAFPRITSYHLFHCFLWPQFCWFDICVRRLKHVIILWFLPPPLNLITTDGH